MGSQRGSAATIPHFDDTQLSSVNKSSRRTRVTMRVSPSESVDLFEKSAEALARVRAMASNTRQ
jgi:hypothetical protein